MKTTLKSPDHSFGSGMIILAVLTLCFALGAAAEALEVHAAPHCRQTPTLLSQWFCPVQVPKAVTAKKGSDALDDATALAPAFIN